MLARPSARRTLRPVHSLTAVAFAEGGNAGTLLAKRLVMPASRETDPQHGGSQTHDPEGAGSRRCGLEQRRPLWHAAGRLRSPDSRGPAAGSGSSDALEQWMPGWTERNRAGRSRFEGLLLASRGMMLR